MNLVVVKKNPKQKGHSLQPALPPIALNVISPKSLGGRSNDHKINMTPVVFNEI